jgi:hypothetical protein
MRVHLGRALVVAALFVFNADTGARASESAGCYTCVGSGGYWPQCWELFAPGSGYTHCEIHTDVEHGAHCDFSGEACVVVY